MQRQTGIETTSCVYGEGDQILYHWQNLGKPSRFAPKSKRSLKLNPLKVHQLSP